MPTVGRKRTKDFGFPPNMHKKGEFFYFVTSTQPRKWIKLDKDLARSRVMWAQIMAGPGGGGDTFNEALDNYLVSKGFMALADKTRRQYESVSKEIRAGFRGQTLQSVTPGFIAKWMDVQVSPIQANTGKAIISNVFNVAARYDKVALNPAKGIKYLKIEGRDRLISDAEFDAIYTAAPEHVQIAMDIAYLTGTRVQDILDIKLQDCSADGVYIKVGKTGKRMLFVAAPAFDAVIARARALPRSIRGMHLLCNRQGQPYPYCTFNDHWLKAVRATGIEGVHFHDIRAKAATDAKALGLDYQRLLGHATKAMSDRYIRSREVDRVAVLPAMATR